MKKTVCVILMVVCASAMTPLLAHDVPNIKHTHAFQKTDYGKYRQGHYVNGPQGDIVIWSAQPKTGYKPGPAVEFARPEPISKKPASANLKPALKSNPQMDYGKPKKQ